MERYEPIKVLGEGAFGKVYLMRDRTARSLVCTKVIKIKVSLRGRDRNIRRVDASKPRRPAHTRSPPPALQNIPRKEREACRVEVDLLRRLNHPNIVGYKDSFLSKNKESLCIVMTYCDGGDLAGQIKQAAKSRKLFAEAKILHWCVALEKPVARLFAAIRIPLVDAATPLRPLTPPPSPGSSSWPSACSTCTRTGSCTAT